MRRPNHAFTLAELLVSIAVLTLFVLIATRMINSATTVVTLGTKRIDADSQVRPVLDRMAVDFSQMIRRSDVDYYVKSNLDTEPGNDRIAFFSTVTGYYPPTGYQSPISLVAYRVNSDPSSSSLNRLERMGKGLLWSGVSTTDKPIFFGLQAIYNNWPAATDATSVDADYELIGPQIVRFEYFYLLRTGATSHLPGANGMQDIAAIVVAVACIDVKSRALLTDCQIGGQPTCGSPYADNGLIQRMADFDTASHPKLSDLTNSWQSVLDGITDMPRAAINGVRIYQRTFYLLPAQ